VRRNIQVNEQNMIGLSKSISTEVRTASQEITELKQEMHDLREEMRLMINELKQTVKKDELKTIERYMQLWEPLNFVSHEEMQRYIDQVLENKTFIKQRGK
jgi:methyl-accepting chemotaxis protein